MTHRVSAAQDSLASAVSALLHECINDEPIHRRSPQQGPTCALDVAPRVCLSEFILRLVVHAYVSPECFPMACALLLRSQSPQVRSIVPELAPADGSGLNLTLTHANVCNVFLGSLMLCAKLNDDVNYNMKHWSQITGLTCAELSEIELLVFTAADFDVSVSPRQFLAAAAALLAYSQQGVLKCISRAWVPTMPLYEQVLDAGTTVAVRGPKPVRGKRASSLT
jgi:hypothetical protein